jgi:hypothetical protein
MHNCAVTFTEKIQKNIERGKKEMTKKKKHKEEIKNASY